jgi:hypothetical protein
VGNKKRLRHVQSDRHLSSLSGIPSAHVYGAIVAGGGLPFPVFLYFILDGRFWPISEKVYFDNWCYFRSRMGRCGPDLTDSG